MDWGGENCFTFTHSLWLKDIKFPLFLPLFCDHLFWNCFHHHFYVSFPLFSFSALSRLTPLTPNTIVFEEFEWRPTDDVGGNFFRSTTTQKKNDDDRNEDDENFLGRLEFFLYHFSSNDVYSDQKHNRIDFLDEIYNF